MNRPLLLFALIALIHTTVHGQTTANFELLREYVGQEKVDALIADQPEKAKFLAFWNEHGYYVAEIPPGKTVDYSGHVSEIEPLYSTTPLPDATAMESKTWGVLGYDFGASEITRYFQMSNGKMLVVLPESIVRRLYTQKNKQTQ